MPETQQQAPGANTPNPTLVQELFKSHWRIEDDINSARMQHAGKVGGLRKQQNAIRERLKNEGLSVRAFKELVNEEADRRRIANRKAKLEDEDVEQVDLLRTALGPLSGLPLGEAAVEAVEKKNARAAAKKTLNDELDGIGGPGGAPAPKDQVADNVTLLKQGIKPLRDGKAEKGTKH